MRPVRVTAALLSIVLCIVGAGGCGGTDETVLSPKELLGDIALLKLGVPESQVVDAVGDPISRSATGSIDEWNYGSWQLTFRDGRLIRKARVRMPPKHGPPATNASGIADLQAGITIGQTETDLGTPEAIYEIWEGREEQVTVLRYGAWQLTFVDGQLSQKAR